MLGVTETREVTIGILKRAGQMSQKYFGNGLMVQDRTCDSSFVLI